MGVMPGERTSGRKRYRRGKEHDNTDVLLLSLSDRPRTEAEVWEQFVAFARRMGFFTVQFEADREESHHRTELANDLARLVEAGLVECHGDRYELTPLGRQQAGDRLAGLRKLRMWLRRLLRPETVSQVSLGVHLLLAAIKLPAGLLSGSVGLINDATDTLLDGLSSLLVYAGIRFDRERVVNGVLVLLMLGTGVLTLYEAVRRLFEPVEPAVDWFTFAAALVSAGLCALLAVYQRYVGVRSGSVALITQSVDSRNHVIVAGSVTAGLLAALLRFPLLDTLVGLAVAALILKSAVELAIEWARSFGEEEMDLARYRVGMVERYEQFRRDQLRDWMLFLLREEGALPSSDLAARAYAALDFTDNPTLAELGLAEEPRAHEIVDCSLQDLFAQGWVEESGGLIITEAGRDHLDRQMGHPRRRSHMMRGGRARHGA